MSRPVSFLRGSAGPVLRIGSLSLLLHPRALLVPVSLLALVALLGLWTMTMGHIELSAPQVLKILLGQGEGGVGERIVLGIRLPRLMTAVFVGAALGTSGAIFQSVSRNALGSPDIIGFTTGAATGALLRIVLAGPGSLEVAMSAVAGGLGTALVVYLLSARGASVGGYRLILVGIGVGSVLTALNGLLLVKGDLDNAIAANLWLAGSLAARNWAHAGSVMAGVLLLLPVVLALARPLAVIEMGDEQARQLGVEVERVRLSALFCAVVLAALATGAAGPIAFVALAAPQLAARLAGANGPCIIGAAAMGSCLLVAADLLTQALPTRITLPIGRTTGIIGGLYLLWLLSRPQRRYPSA
ncbi:TPA: FecCD family ABC transporter permease [Stenotrophomonas maltophilia]|uniref:FecCD family ABC transporter permease n=1 Tax=Stenotrophomonas TaxID=40323 RepID=UPI000C150DA5|nr:MULTISPECIES: iron chelate uptake ABC transporter family permease subunit [Stenotrophomonas]